MKFIDRFPAFVYVGAGVLWAGFVKNHRRWESRITARLTSFARQPHTSFINPYPVKGGNVMLKVLVPADGSPNSLHAVRHVVNQFMKDSAMEIHLLNVQPPFSLHIARFVSKKNRNDFHRDQGEKALRPVREMLSSFGIPHAVHIEVGDKAKLIAEAARRMRCDQIVMSAARKNSLTRMIEDSTTNKVLELTDVPVEIIAGDAVSKLERYGIPAGIGTALALLFLAAAD